MEYPMQPYQHNNPGFANQHGPFSQQPRASRRGRRADASTSRPVPIVNAAQAWVPASVHNLHATAADQNWNHSNNTSGNSSAANLTQKPFFLVPILPPDNLPKLDWRPFCLTATVLWINAMVCLTLAGVIFAVLYGVGSDRQALLTSENAHILSTYSPTLIATINLLCFRSTFYEYFRILPYYRMADQKDIITTGALAAKSVGGSYFPWVFASYGDDPWRKLLSQLLLFSVGLLTTFKSVFLGSQETKEGNWILTVHQKPAFYLVGAYFAMSLFYIIVWLISKNRSTGLKWDPAAPCDHLALVWRTDAMAQIAELPINYEKAYEVLPKDVKWRVGYWRRYDNLPNGQRIETIVHGIGTLEGRRGNPCNEEGVCTCETGGRCSFSRYLYPPMSNSVFLSIFLIILLAFVGLLVYIAASGIFVDGAHLSGSWLKLNSTYAPDAVGEDASATEINNGYVIIAGQVIKAGDSTPANIIFRAIPTYIAGLYVPYFDGMEIRLRDITWISALAAGPQPASKSLALDYATQFSFVIPATATEQRHFRLAFVAFVNTFAPLLPVFVAGLVIFERKFATVLHLLISKTSFVVISGYLVFFIAATIASWPRKTELLLRPFFSIADLVKPFADSWLLEEDTVLDSAMAERTRERFRAKILLAEYCYQLGVTKGTCGKSHRGIDIIGSELGEKYRAIIPAKDLITKMKTHQKGSNDGYSAIQAGLEDLQHTIVRSATRAG